MMQTLEQMSETPLHKQNAKFYYQRINYSKIARRYYIGKT